MTKKNNAGAVGEINVIQDGRLRQAQLKMLRMLEVVDRICQKHQLDYWLDAGTLLGAIRHQGFIPWDDDMDIAMPRSSYDAFLRVAPAELPATMFLQTAHTDPGFFNMAVPLKIRDTTSYYVEKHETGNESYVHGIFIDVFVYDKLSANIKQRKRDKWKAKKLSRFLAGQCSQAVFGHYSDFYRLLGRFLPKSMLEKSLNRIIQRNNKQTSPYLGRGYQCVGSNCLRQEDIYPLKRVRFETGEFNVPNHFDVPLSQQYGDYMSLPPQNERTLRHCVELIP